MYVNGGSVDNVRMREAMKIIDIKNTKIRSVKLKRGVELNNPHCNMVIESLTTAQDVTPS